MSFVHDGIAFKHNQNFDYRQAGKGDKNLEGEQLGNEYTVFYYKKSKKIIPLDYVTWDVGYSKNGRKFMILDGEVYVGK